MNALVLFAICCMLSPNLSIRDNGLKKIFTKEYATRLLGQKLAERRIRMPPALPQVLHSQYSTYDVFGVIRHFDAPGENYHEQSI